MSHAEPNWFNAHQVVNAACGLMDILLVASYTERRRRDWHSLGGAIAAAAAAAAAACLDAGWMKMGWRRPSDAQTF